MLTRGKILLMDDDDITRRLTANKLQRMGYQADVAGNGHLALSMYRDALIAGAPYDAVILDLVVEGGLGGEETMKRLLEIDPSVKAIATSAFVDEPAMSDFWDSGFRGVLAKPYSAADLDHALQTLTASGG